MGWETSKILKHIAKYGRADRQVHAKRALKRMKQIGPQKGFYPLLDLCWYSIPSAIGATPTPVVTDAYAAMVADAYVKYAHYNGIPEKKP